MGERDRRWDSAGVQASEANATILRLVEELSDDYQVVAIDSGKIRNALWLMERVGVVETLPQPGNEGERQARLILLGATWHQALRDHPGDPVRTKGLILAGFWQLVSEAKAREQAVEERAAQLDAELAVAIARVEAKAEEQRPDWLTRSQGQVIRFCSERGIPYSDKASGKKGAMGRIERGGYIEIDHDASEPGAYTFRWTHIDLHNAFIRWEVEPTTLGKFDP